MQKACKDYSKLLEKSALRQFSIKIIGFIEKVLTLFTLYYFKNEIMKRLNRKMKENQGKKGDALKTNKILELLDNSRNKYGTR